MAELASTFVAACLVFFFGYCTLIPMNIKRLHGNGYACCLYTSHVNLNNQSIDEYTMNLPFAQTVLLISPPHAILLFTWRWLPVDFSLQVHARPGGHPFLRSVPGICVHAREPAVADYQWEGGIRSARASDHEGALRHWRRIR